LRSAVLPSRSDPHFAKEEPFRCRNQGSLPEGGADPFENVIVLGDESYNEILAHPIPTNVNAVKVLASAPAVLDLFMWLVYRCFVASVTGGADRKVPRRPEISAARIADQAVLQPSRSSKH
jgi:hypothetical protein